MKIITSQCYGCKHDRIIEASVERWKKHFKYETEAHFTNSLWNLVGLVYPHCPLCPFEIVFDSMTDLRWHLKLQHEKILVIGAMFQKFFGVEINSDE